MGGGPTCQGGCGLPDVRLAVGLVGCLVDQHPLKECADLHIH
jgi:hypothetical protein